MTENFLEKLFEHNDWANLQIIQACSALSDERLDAEPQSATKGSIRSTLLHLVTSQRGYLSLLTLPVEVRPNTPLAFAELEESAGISGEGLLELVRDKPSKQQIKSMFSALGATPPDIDGWDYGGASNALTTIST